MARSQDNIALGATVQQRHARLKMIWASSRDLAPFDIARAAWYFPKSFSNPAISEVLRSLAPATTELVISQECVIQMSSNVNNMTSGLMKTTGLQPAVRHE
jgi:hypothetical protein